MKAIHTLPLVLAANSLCPLQAEECAPLIRAVGFYQSRPLTDPTALLNVEIERPSPKPHDILVRVKAISVNPVDTKHRKRVESKDGVPVVLGWDVAGIVEKVGGDVSDFKVGDEVFYAGDITRPGANSELHVVDSRLVALKPKEISFEEAASMPLTALTAFEALFEQLGIRVNARNESKTILIIGGAGGVGSMAIQMAKRAGLRVVTTAGRAVTTEWVKRMGADVVLDHHHPLKFQMDELNIGEVDYIFNTVSTSDYWTQMADAIRPFGRIVSIVESEHPLDLRLFMKKSVSFSWELMFTRSMYSTPDMERQGKILGIVAEWLRRGWLQPTLRRHLSPINADNLIKAHRLLESGTSIGKIVLSDWE